MVRNEKDTVNKYKEFFNSLENSDLTYYTAYGYDVDVTDKGNTIRQQVITKKFMDVFQKISANIKAIRNRTAIFAN